MQRCPSRDIIIHYPAVSRRDIIPLCSPMERQLTSCSLWSHTKAKSTTKHDETAPNPQTLKYLLLQTKSAFNRLEYLGSWELPCSCALGRMAVFAPWYALASAPLYSFFPINGFIRRKLCGVIQLGRYLLKALVQNTAHIKFVLIPNKRTIVVKLVQCPLALI